MVCCVDAQLTCCSWVKPYLHELTFSRNSLADLDSVWHPSIQQSTLQLVQSLNESHAFLEQNETPEMFVKNFKFGGKWHVYKRRFTICPIWYKNGYYFKNDDTGGGLPAFMKNYLAALHIKVMKGAYGLPMNQIGKMSSTE